MPTQCSPIHNASKKPNVTLCSVFKATRPKNAQRREDENGGVNEESSTGTEKKAAQCLKRLKRTLAVRGEIRR